jgi:transposase
MDKNITMTSGLTIGLDLGDKSTVGCVSSPSGEVVETFTVSTTMSALGRTMDGFDASRVVLEVGTHSAWISRLAERSGHEVIIANPRRVRLIAENDSKTDEVDAELLARLGRVDPGLLKPIVHRGERAQHDRILLLARDGLVRSRTQFINQVRGFAKSLGYRIPRCSTKAFPGRVREQFSEDLFPGQSAMLDIIDRLTQEILRLDREAENLCQERYPETGVLRQVKGVGALTALGFVLTLEDPSRFAKSRTVGAYLGLRPRLRQSGEQQPQLRITKAGDALLRRYLVGAAQYILGPFGPDTELRRFGLKLAERGGSAAKKRAVVAVARKLSVLLHRLWVTGEEYQSLGYGQSTQEAA